MIKGVVASNGVAIGNVFSISSDLQSVDYTVGSPKQEQDRFDNAVKKYKELIEKKSKSVEKKLGKEQADILNGRLVMLADPYVIKEITDSISNGKGAVDSIIDTLTVFENMFENSGDRLIAERAADVRELKQGLVMIVKGVEEKDISTAPKGSVLVANEITASMIADIDDNIVAMIGFVGGFTSHCAILARALEIPFVLGVEINQFIDKQDVIVDGDNGIVIVNPKNDEKDKYNKEIENNKKNKERLKVFIGKETRTQCGEKKWVYCNIGSIADAERASKSDGEGVGLFRTEFLYMDGKKMPTEDEQFAVYKKVAMIFKDKAVVIRTLDIGGDKDIPYMNLPKEENPFLGHRAIRYCLSQKDIFKTQLRALLRASYYGTICIMIPMITCLEEVIESKKLIEEAKKELDKEKIPYDKNIEFGIMSETAASVMIADVLAKEVDFFSIGTNDLTQYVMAADRGNANVSSLCTVYHPAVLRAIKRIILSGKQNKTFVAMCGEVANDRLMLPLLLSWGLDEFSVSASSVLALRASIGLWTKKDADEIEKNAMNLRTAKEVHDYLQKHAKTF